MFDCLRFPKHLSSLFVCALLTGWSLPLHAQETTQAPSLDQGSGAEQGDAREQLDADANKPIRTEMDRGKASRRPPAVIGRPPAVIEKSRWSIWDSMPLLRNTILLALSVSALAIPLGTLMALLLVRTDLALRRVHQTILLAMLFLPPFIHVAGWDAGFGLQGWVSRVVGPGTILLDGWPGAVWVYVVTVLPWVVLLVSLSLLRVPAQLEESASLNASSFRVFRHVTLPATLPGILLSALWIFILVANEVTITDVYQIRTYAEEVYVGFALGDSLQEAQVRVLPGTFLIGILVVSSFRLCRSTTTSIPNAKQGRFRFRLGKWRGLASIVALLLMAIVVLVPLVNLGWKAGVEVVQTNDGRIRTWSPLKLVQMVAQSPVQHAEEMAWSLGIGQLASISAVLLSFAMAWLRKPIWRVTGLLLAVLGFSIPGPILALGIARLFSQPNFTWLNNLYDNTIVPAWLVLFIRTFPFAFILASYSVATINRNLFESSTLDGANAIQQLRHVGVPQLASSVLGTWLICLAYSMGELSATIISLPPGVMTLSVLIFNMVHYGVEDQLAGICLFNTTVFIAISFFGLRLLRIGDDDN